jgi:hypothetical protein
MEQRAQGTLQIWAEPFTRLRVPKIFNLRTDPYERADQTSNTYYQWLVNFQQRYQMRNRILSKTVPALEFCPFRTSQKCVPLVLQFWGLHILHAGTGECRVFSARGGRRKRFVASGA